jgi:5-methylcytosine-specific restriction protein A
MPRCSDDELADLEQVLLDYAPQFTNSEIAKLCRQVIDRYDPDGAEPREERLRAQAGVTVIHGRDGLVTWIVKMHPEAAGVVTTAVDARTAPRRQPTFLDAEDHDPVIADERTLAQKRLDALLDMATQSLAADNGQMAGTVVTLSVTMTLESLISGLGSAVIDGVDEPISASTARRLAANAMIIPVVLGGDSEPLDVGLAHRLFTESQRRALAVRDGGCIWPGCDAPPGWCEVAHIVPWSRGGPTNLANGALLCRFHHRRLDNDGWQLERQDGVWWLTPPAWLDASHTPRRAGKLPRAARYLPRAG